jgi:hypothetical protein
LPGVNFNIPPTTDPDINTSAITGSGNTPSAGPAIS